MKRALALAFAGAVLLAGCGDPKNGEAVPSEGCRGHDGVRQIEKDATDGGVPFTCNDGTVGAVYP